MLLTFKPSGRYAAYGRAIDFINGQHNPDQDGAFWEAKAKAIDIVGGEFEIIALHNPMSGKISIIVDSFIDPQDDYH